MKEMKELAAQRAWVGDWPDRARAPAAAARCATQAHWKRRAQRTRESRRRSEESLDLEGGPA